MKKILSAILVLAVVCFWTQCSKQDIQADEAAIESLIMEDSIWFNTGTTVDSTSNKSFSNRDTLVVWWRGVQTHNQPTIQINIVDDSAWVSWSRGNYGYLYSLAYCDTPPWVLWTKDVAETAQIRATFLRVGGTSGENRGWQLHSLSLATGVSDSVNTVRLDSVRIESQSYPNLVIKNPLNTYYSVDNLLTFTSAEDVTLTLYTNVVDGEAFLHTFIFAWPFYVRVNFTNQGNGVYQGTWQTQVLPFPRYAIFDLLDHSTLYTPDGLYDFSGWLLPYTISP